MQFVSNELDFVLKVFYVTLLMLLWSVTLSTMVECDDVRCRL